MRAFLNLRHWESDRTRVFVAGLDRLGYKVERGIGKADLFVTWNRIQTADSVARKCEAEGIPVIVSENPSWGFGPWLHLARTRHNTAGMFPIGDKSRWDRLEVELEPFRTSGETVILGQRGIGSKPVAQPRGWERTQSGRLRAHPGRGVAKPLREDLAHAGKVVTWGSAAAVQALMWGVPVESYMPDWIGRQDNTDVDRLRMFREMAWAQWLPAEIESGEAFKWLLQ